MNLVIISPFQFSSHRGIERFSYSLANAMARKGFNVTIYTWSGKQNKVDWGKWHPEIKIRVIPRVRYFQAYRAGYFYRKWIKSDRPDYIILNFLYYGERWLPAQFKYVYVLHSPASAIGNRYVYIQKRLQKFPDLQFVAVSDMVKQEAIPFAAGRKITVINNGVDTELFRPSPKKTDETHEKIRIISAAALEERKGIQHMISALRQMNPYHREKIKYDVFGEGPYQKNLQDLIHKYKLEDTVSLHAPVNNLNELLPDYDLFCLLSKGEAFGLSVVEALACGLPIIASDSPPLNEMVDERCGICVDPGNTEGIITFLESLVATDHRKDWSESSRKRSLLYSWEGVAGQYGALLSKT